MLVVLDYVTEAGQVQLPSQLPIETEREKEVVQQLKQASDTATRLRDELRQAAGRETQLQLQLDSIKRDVS